MRFHRLNILYILLCWLAVVIVVLLFPMPDVHPEIKKITFYDKAIHLVLFTVLSFLTVIFLDSFKKISLKKASFATLLIGSFLVFISEYLQAFIPGRNPEALDFLAGLAGVLLALLLARLIYHRHKKKILLHVCCATCTVWVQKLLREKFRVVLFYFNPNTYPLDEYRKRLADIKKIAFRENLQLIVADYDHAKWKNKIKGREKDPEGGDRCLICYRDRLEATAKKAREQKIRYFASTLSVSPHKNAEKINTIGEALAKKYKLFFLPENFKKKNGFKISMELSKKRKFYRQDYCGCEFSKKPNKKAA